MAITKRTSVRKLLDLYTERMQEARRPIFGLQVGANDGRTNDPLYKYFSVGAWRGLLAEPLPDVFAQGLAKNYAGNPHVIIENVAVGTTPGNLPFYRLKISQARWATGLSSFRRETLVHHFDTGYIQQRAALDGLKVPESLDEAIEEISVPTKTIAGLVGEHGIEQIDVICMDTEGYDFEILKMIDFDRFHPDLIVFERKHLDAETLDATLSLLSSHGYDVMRDGGNAAALSGQFELVTVKQAQALADPLTVKAWRRVRRLFNMRLRRSQNEWAY